MILTDTHAHLYSEAFDEDRIERTINNGLLAHEGENVTPLNIAKIIKGREEAKIKIATARCARVSYLNFEGKDDYEADIKLYDRLLAMKHLSPFEHCARAMSKEEYLGGDLHYVKGDPSHGWSGNFRGFVQLRKEIE